MKRKTNAEIAADKWLMALALHESEPCSIAFSCAAAEIGRNLKQDEWGAIVAIRDYAQYRLAQLQDEREAATQKEIERLSSRLRCGEDHD